MSNEPRIEHRANRYGRTVIVVVDVDGAVFAAEDEQEAETVLALVVANSGRL